MISMGSTLINLGDSLPSNLSKPSYGRVYVHQGQVSVPVYLLGRPYKKRTRTDQAGLPAGSLKNKIKPPNRKPQGNKGQSLFRSPLLGKPTLNKLVVSAVSLAAFPADLVTR